MAPKQNTQVTEEPLTCFPVWCLCLCSPTLHKPFQKGGGGKKWGDQGAEERPKPAVTERVPRRPCPALRCGERCGLGRSRPARSPSELLVFAATSSFYRFGCAERRGYYRSNAVLSLFPRPLPGLCLCSSVTQQKARGAAARPLNGRQCAAASTGGAPCRLRGVRFRRLGPDLLASGEPETPGLRCAKDPAFPATERLGKKRFL